MKLPALLVLVLALPAWSQVLDVNGDSEVGPEEALALAEEWKGSAIRANDHNHLGQTWVGNRNPLTIRGSFPIAIIPTPLKEDEKGSGTRTVAPLILRNEATTTEGGATNFPDLILGGHTGILSAPEEVDSNLILRANGSMLVAINRGNSGDAGQGIYFFANNSDGSTHSIMLLSAEGDMEIAGSLTAQNVTTKIDHPLDPENKFLNHSSVKSPELKNVYDGIAPIDENGEAVVDLPPYFEAANSTYRYTLTPIGAPAPNLHVANEISDNRFKIAGGVPGKNVSWQVTGVRQDPYAKAHPVEAEQEKTEEEKERYLHPELDDAPMTKSAPQVE